MVERDIINAEISNSVIKSEEFVSKNLNTILPKLLDNVFINVKLKTILTENQISKIVNSGYDLLVQEFENSDTLKGEELLINLMNEIFCCIV